MQNVDVYIENFLSPNNNISNYYERHTAQEIIPLTPT
jgi:hypothetical protein